MSDRQRTFFDFEFQSDLERKRHGSTVYPIDPNARDADLARLKGQNGAILRRLHEGPATNAELATISLKYTSRISDLRAAGYVVTCKRLAGGVTEYQLGAKQQGDG